MDLNGLLTLDEFEVLLQELEPELHSGGQAAVLFEEFAHLTDNRVEYLSLSGLASMATKYGILSNEAQRGLLGNGCSSDFGLEVQFVREVYPEMRQIFLRRLASSAQKAETWEARLTEYETRLKTSTYSNKCMLLQ